jgi:hypothetical protein
MRPKVGRSLGMMSPETVGVSFSASVLKNDLFPPSIPTFMAGLVFGWQQWKLIHFR